MDTQIIDRNGWKTTVHSTPFVMAGWMVEQCLRLVADANAAFTYEDTAVRSRLGEPTACGRLDFTVTGENGGQLTPVVRDGKMHAPEGIVRPYEWEERPAGKGLVGELNPEFKTHFAELRRDWPDITIVIDGSRKGRDDTLWAGDDRTIIGPDVPDDGSLVLVRAEPGQAEYHSLAHRSVSTLRTKGDKTYGAKLGWWSEVTHLGQLPPAGVPIVLKPLQGSKTQGILMSASSRYRQQGMVTRTKLEEKFAGQVERDGLMYLQPWYPAMDLNGQNLVLRVFFGRGYSQGSPWQCLGGTWNARKNALVHGATDTLFGPAILD